MSNPKDSSKHPWICLGKFLFTNTGVFWQCLVYLVNGVVRPEFTLVSECYAPAPLQTSNYCLSQTHLNNLSKLPGGKKNCQSLEELRFILQSCDKNKLRNKFWGREMPYSLSHSLNLFLTLFPSIHLCSDSQCCRV